MMILPSSPVFTQACWVLHYFCEVKFKSDQNLQTALELTRLCLINDTQMPVRVEAAIALQVLISNQEKGEEEEDGHPDISHFFLSWGDGSVF